MIVCRTSSLVWVGVFRFCTGILKIQRVAVELKRREAMREIILFSNGRKV